MFCHDDCSSALIYLSLQNHAQSCDHFPWPPRKGGHKCLRLWHISFVCIQLPTFWLLLQHWYCSPLMSLWCAKCTCWFLSWSEIHRKVFLCVWVWKHKHAVVLGNRRRRQSKRDGVHMSLTYCTANHTEASHSLCCSLQMTAHCHSPQFPSQLLSHPLAVLMFCDMQSRCQRPHIIKDFSLCRAWAFPAQLSQP